MKLINSLVVLYLLASVGCENKILRVPLHLKHEQKHLIALVNMLQKSHAEILQNPSYEHATHTPLKKQSLHIQHLQQTQALHLKHTKAPIITSHKMRHDSEGLMDIEPKQIEGYISDTLQPVDQNIEDGLEGENKMFFKELFSDDNDIKKLKVKGNVPLENMGNTMFIGGMQVGTDNGKNTFQVIFDTGSALTCITSKLCHDIGCKKSHQYDRHKSQTFDEIGKQVEITFGSGTLIGLVNKEQITVDGLSLKSAVFIEITQQIGDAFRDGDFDGIVGLGYPHMTGVPTLFDYMIRQHKLDSNVFTFHLNRESGNSESQLVFGGVDNDLVSGEWTYHDVTEKFYWTIPATAMYVGDKDTGICSVKKPCKMVVDTGTTLLTGPTNDVRKLLSLIKVSPRCSNFYEMPSITFLMANKKYTLDAADYVLTITDDGVEPPFQHSSREEIISCAGTIFPMDIEEPQGPLWILGDVFISKYSAAFDRDKDQVGLALSKWYVDQKKQNQL